MNPERKLFICLYSDPNFLSVNILENLLSKNCLINIVSDDIRGWEEKTERLSAKNRFGLTNKTNFNKEQVYDYVIFCGGFLKKANAISDYKDMIRLPNLQRVKSLILFPFEIFNAKDSGQVEITDNTSVIYVGDLLGPRIDLNSDLFINECLSEVISNRKLTVPLGEIFYPVFAPDAVRLIIKWLFSFGPYGRELMLFGPDTSSSDFLEKNKKMVGGITPKFIDAPSLRIPPKGIEIQRLDRDLNFCLSETYHWLAQNRERFANATIGSKKTMPVSLHVKTHISSRTRGVLVVFLFILLFPFLTLLLCAGIALTTYREFISGNDGLATNSMLVAKTFAVTGGEESKVLSYIPLLGVIYKETAFASKLGEGLSIAAIDAIPIVRSSTALFDNVLGNQPYDPAPITINIGNSLSNIERDVLLIEQNTQTASGQRVVLAEKVLANVDFEKIKKIISQGQVLTGRLPDILGKNQSKTYLVLFENNMELRPTGGFIGSYGLMTFDSGRLSDFAISDVYSADGQLNGHVEPPAPIKQYLGEANWWLRDSNWDPDFPTSAQRAEWFLGKEIGKQVDGVAAVDLFPIKEILKYTGPIFLPDYNLDITSDNLYEKTESEAQDNSFAGSRQKASFLTALSGSLLSEIGKLNPKQKLSVLESFYSAFDERHVQLYLHDDASENALNIMGWDGSVTLPSCSGNCYADMAGLSEANVGVNKANYFIQRTINLTVSLGSSEIDRTLTLNLKNNANQGLGKSGEYTDYIRLLIPGDAEVVNIESITGQNQETLTPEVTEEKGRKEAGVLVDVLNGQNKTIVFSWKSQINTSSPYTLYGLYLRKQAGTDADPLTVDIKPVGVITTPDPRFSLTREGDYVYNTTLAQDLFTSFSW
jgi:hypothetical protein